MLLRKFKILGHSMEPAFKNGDIVIASNIPYIFRKPKVKDVIAALVKEKIYIKRVKNINNGKYFIEGDNKRDSIDSKKLGSINKKQILGKIVYKVK